MNRISGVLSPVVTPFDRELKPDATRLAAHCRWLAARRVGLAVFGTTSEGNSLSVGERIDLLDRLATSGIEAARMMPGTGCCALSDAVRLTSHAVKLGCAGVLMLPPFYYKGVSDEGLFRSYAEVIERVGDERLNVYLYHIPQVSQVPIPHSVIERLLDAYPKHIAGVKDSSGDWNNTKTMLERFAPRGFDVFPGNETFLLASMRLGGKGCISATANVNPAALHDLYVRWRAQGADELQKRLDAVRTVFQGYPMVPALKAAIAHWSGDAEWRRVRPPLVELDQGQAKALIASLAQQDFSIEGLKPER
jgi:4-hydroxy-tetrahydrodipicolinate synthase